MHLVVFHVFQENIKPSDLGDKHRDALFKKFVKKWNGNKLPQVSYSLSRHNLCGFRLTAWPIFCDLLD